MKQETGSKTSRETFNQKVARLLTLELPAGVDNLEASLQELQRLKTELTNKRKLAEQKDREVCQVLFEVTAKIKRIYGTLSEGEDMTE
jgi:hypothetical protein